MVRAVLAVLAGLEVRERLRQEVAVLHHQGVEAVALLREVLLARRLRLALRVVHRAARRLRSRDRDFVRSLGTDTAVRRVGNRWRWTTRLACRLRTY